MKNQRQRDILSYILANRSATITELENEFGVSGMTVRRDLSELESGGQLIRVSGGAVVANDAYKEPPYKTRIHINKRQKKEISQMAEEMIADGELIFLDVGTSCLQLAERLTLRDIIVVTNWTPNVLELTKGNTCEVIAIGGKITMPEMVAVGVSTYDAIGNFRFERAFIGIGGIAESGISDYHVESVEIKKRVIECAKEVVVLADDSKFGKQAPVQIAPLESINKVILSDASKVDAELLHLMRTQGIALIN